LWILLDFNIWESGIEKLDSHKTTNHSDPLPKLFLLLTIRVDVEYSVELQKSWQNG